jgi:hypothetical protein
MVGHNMSGANASRGRNRNLAAVLLLTLPWHCLSAGAQTPAPAPDRAAIEAQIAELRQLSSKARQDAADAQAAATRAETMIGQLLTILADRTEAPAPRSDTTKVPVLDNVTGLQAYVDTPERTEEELHRYLVDAQGRTPAPKSLAGQPSFRGTISAAKDGTQAVVGYQIPLSRRIDTFREDGVEKRRAVAMTLGFGASATLDEKNRGVIVKSGDLTDKPLGLSFSFNWQYFPEATTADATATARKKVTEMVALCEADRSKHNRDGLTQAERFGQASALRDADSCSGQALLDWAFATKADGRFVNMDAVNAYNAAVWLAPAADDIPEYGFGIKLDSQRQRFSYIDPAVFPPGTISAPGIDPPLLSTLDFTELGGKKKVTYDWGVGAYAFRHWSGSLGPFEGLTTIPRIRFGRKWSLPKDSDGIEFCMIDAPSYGGSAIPGADNRRCEKFNIAHPQRDSGFEYSIEARTMVDVGRLSRVLPEIGFGPSFGYKEIEQRYQLIAPFYIAFDKDKKLNGGIQVAHEWGGQEKKDTVVSIFYSTAFSLKGNE